MIDRFSEVVNFLLQIQYKGSHTGEHLGASLHPKHWSLSSEKDEGGREAHTCNFRIWRLEDQKFKVLSHITSLRPAT